MYAGGGTQTEFMFDVKNEWKTYFDESKRITHSIGQ